MTRRRRRLERCAWLASLLLSWLAAGAAAARAAHAEAQQQARIDLLVLEDPSTDWGRRVRGQLSDLPAHADIQVSTTLARATPKPAARATKPALTAWIATGSDPASRQGEGTFIVIWFAGSEKPYTRRIAADWKALSEGDRSAALELAALSVRSAVRSLLLDPTALKAPPTAPARTARTARPAATASSTTTASSAITANPIVAASRADAASGVDAASIVASDAANASRPPDERRARRAGTDRATIVSEPEPERVGPALPVRFGLELGAAWQFYGRTTLGAPGMRAGVQLLVGAWGIELIGQYGWPVAARIGPAAFDLQRHAALAELSLVAVDFEAWRFSPLLRAGLTWLRRDGTHADGGDTALQASRPENYRSPFLGAGAIVEQRLSAALSLSLRAVLNVETAIPTFTLVDATGARVSSASPWSAQPSIEIGANWRW